MHTVQARRRWPEYKGTKDALYNVKAPWKHKLLWGHRALGQSQTVKDRHKPLQALVG